MGAVELTRMDFHVSRFMNSEDVREMTACEVGQYCLLLFEAWMIGKDCTLPEEEGKVARYARVETVAPGVLAKFPVVETEEYGPRRRNDVQFEIWGQAKARSEAGRQAADASWAVRRQKQADSGATSGATAVASGSVLLRSTHTKPIQTGTEQTNPEHTIAPERASVPLNPQPNTGSDWSTLAVKHKRFFGKQASSTLKAQYGTACAKYGEDVVLECFNDWAPDALDWVKANDVKQPLFAFFKKLPDMAETVVGAREADAAEVTQRAADAARAQQETTQREQQVVAARKADADKWDSMTKPSTDNEVSLADYLEEDTLAEKQ